MKTHTFFTRIPITGHEVYAEAPSLSRGRTCIDWASHKSSPDLTGPGGFLVWIGRLHIVLSRRSTAPVSVVHE